MKKVKIALIDDHAIITDGIQKIILEQPHFELVGVYNNPLTCLEELQHKSVDLVLSDVSMPEMGGQELLPKLKKISSKPKVIMLSMYIEKSIILTCYQLGADGYISKSENFEKILDAIDVVMHNEKYFPYSEKELQNMSEKSEGQLLSNREIEIVKLLASGKSSKQIADTLFLSELTVNTHRRNMLKKTNQPNVASLINFAKQNHLIL